LKVIGRWSAKTVDVKADGTGLSSRAGTSLLALVADRVGLTDGLCEALQGTRERRGGHEPGRVFCDLAVMLADGGRCVSDIQAIAGQASLFGEGASISTARRVVRSVGESQLEGIRASVRHSRATVAADHLRGPCTTPVRCLDLGRCAVGVLMRSLFSPSAIPANPTEQAAEISLVISRAKGFDRARKMNALKKRLPVALRGDLGTPGNPSARGSRADSDAGGTGNCGLVGYLPARASISGTRHQTTRRFGDAETISGCHRRIDAGISFRRSSWRKPE
jgi:hypothetical protein